MAVASDDGLVGMDMQWLVAVVNNSLTTVVGPLLDSDSMMV